MLDVLLSNMHSVIILCIDYRGPYVNMPRTVNGNKVDFIYLLLVVLWAKWKLLPMLLVLSATV